MNWLRGWFADKPDLTPAQVQRLQAWKSQPRPPTDRPISDSRYVVVDVESSGLNIARDHLIAIGAIAVINGRIQLEDSLEIVLQQKQVSDRDNILIHGISGTVQREGIPPPDALLRFLEFMGKDPLIAFHVAFDESMISRAMKRHLGLNFRHYWADLAYIAPALYPREARRLRSLDDWAGKFSIGNYSRHNALADALTTAELLLALRPQIEVDRHMDFSGLKWLESERRRQLRPV